MVKKLWIFLVSALLCCACCRIPAGHIKLNFSFVVDNDSLRLDTCMYHNAAGNLYEVNDVPVLLCIAKLCNKCIVRCAEHCHKQVEYHEKHKKDCIIYSNTGSLRKCEQTNCTKCERNCHCTHEWDTSSAFVAASI